MFLADLVRAMSPRSRCDFIAVSSYGDGHEVVRRGPAAEGPRPRPRGPPRHHRRGHRRHRADADVPAGHPAGARAAVAADGVPAEQAVAAEGGRDGRVHRLHDRGSVRRRLRAGLRGEVPQLPYIAVLDGARLNGACSDSSIITEADARHASSRARPSSSTPGGHVTPLAQDTLRARRVTVVPAGTRRSGAAGGPGAGRRRPARGDRQRPHAASR